MRDEKIKTLLLNYKIQPFCFGVNEKTGQPKHPTYIANGLELKPYQFTPPLRLET